jgi:hypothetical protein
MHLLASAREEHEPRRGPGSSAARQQEDEMKALTKGAAALALLATAAQPCLAAEDLRDLGNPVHRSGAFAGGSVRMTLGGKDEARKPQARLQMGFTHHARDMRSASPGQTLRIASFELGASEKGKPAFYMGGHTLGEMKQKLGMSDAAKVGLGALALVGVLAIAFMASGAPGDFLCDGGDEDCY